MGDIDGFVEINNHFLFVEGKPPRASLDNGQGRALSRLNKLPGVTVVIVEGDPPDHVVGWYVIDSGHTYTGNYSDFSEWVFTYASYADNDWRMN